MTKILILGCPGSGKSTLARKISKEENLPILYLDKIFWSEKGGVKQDFFLKAQKKFINENENWIIDGGFSNSKSFMFRVENCDKIIIIDIPKFKVVYRFLKRSVITFGKSREDMPGNRKETFGTIWGTLKFILKYDTNNIFKRVESLGGRGKVEVVSS